MTRGLLMLILVAGGLLMGPGPAAAADPAWSWPLSPRPVVVRPFVDPAGPYGAGHRGVDLGSAPGAPVLVAGAGVVAFAGRVAGRGVVAVDHPGGLRTTYEPVAATVTRGDGVTAGTVIGHLELPGSHCLPSACLHWGLRRAFTYLDPLSLLRPVHVRLLPVWGPGPLPAGTGAAIPLTAAVSTHPAAVATRPAAMPTRPAAVATRPAAVPTNPAAVATHPAVATSQVVAVAGLVGSGLVLGAAVQSRIRRRRQEQRPRATEQRSRGPERRLRGPPG